ncbi:MAG: lysine--tRNA ligase [Candidatus Nanoarchaeia archaeon]|nr:lysine--tRNA ligase [Candidatus Nanoarchaeia archaeon]MDD5587697.1 lysine--tRNA ligase [Candidatus Nanoarchaeia archaeon]
MAKEIHWADLAAENLIKIKNKESYVCASGITPSGTVHFGNFREVITTALIIKALEDKSKKAKFIYSWDDYDVFRKIPKNMPNQEILQKYLRQPIIDIPDTFGCHKNYAEHNEKKFENDLPLVGIKPKFISQAKMYRECKYAEEIKTAMINRKKIVVILNKYREEPLEENWYPLSIYCEKCNTDDTQITDYDEKYSVSYVCNACKFKDTFDFRKKGISKLSWRADWPMRWYYENVDFEPGGKDHSVAGGSYSTAKEIVKEVWKKEAPFYVMYDFIGIKGIGGKVSSSKGNVITLGEVLEIYEPEITRWIFAASRPNAEFSISFDLDILNDYETFDKCERTYFGEEKIENEDRLQKEKRIYELSCMEIPKKLPIQPSFRHLTNLLQIHNMNEKEVIKSFENEVKNEFDKKRVKNRTICAKNWLEKYAPEELKFKVQENINIKLDKKQKDIIKSLIKVLEKKKYKEQDLFNEFYTIINENKIKPDEFFKLTYNILINKERGPKLATLILAIGQEKIINLLKKVS